LKACCEAGKSFSECVGTCVGISDPALKKLLRGGQVAGGMLARPEMPAAGIICCNKYDANMSGGLDGARDHYGAAEIRNAVTAGRHNDDGRQPWKARNRQPGTGRHSAAPVPKRLGAAKLHCCTDHDVNASGSIDSWFEWMAVFDDDTCVDPDDPSGDCNIVVNIGGDVNGQLNICCKRHQQQRHDLRQHDLSSL
jgi:hypothetical protein